MRNAMNCGPTASPSAERLVNDDGASSISSVVIRSVNATAKVASTNAIARSNSEASREYRISSQDRPDGARRLASAAARYHRSFSPTVGIRPSSGPAGRLTPGLCSHHFQVVTEGAGDVGRAVASAVPGGRGRRVVLTAEFEAPEGGTRRRHDPGEAGVDGGLPGRRQVRARGQRRGLAHAEEGGTSEGTRLMKISGSGEVF